MKYIMSALVAISLFLGINMNTTGYSIGILEQDSGQTWDPQFQEIQIYRKPNTSNNYENIINYVFGNYWTPFPFKIDLNSGTIAFKIKVKGPNDPTNTILWDQNWTGEVWTADAVAENPTMELVATFNKTTEYVVIPRSKIYNNTKAAIRIKGTKDGQEILYDTFYTGLAAVDPSGNIEYPTGPTQDTLPCFVSNMSSFSKMLAKEASTNSFDVTFSKSDCSWNITTTAPEWIEIVGLTQKQGNGTVQFKVKENTSTSLRSGDIVINGYNVKYNVVQVGKAADPIEIIKEVEVIKEVPVEVIKEVLVEVIKEVPIPSLPRLENILVNLIVNDRQNDSSIINVVGLNTKDPLIYSEVSQQNLMAWGRNLNYEFGNGQRNREMIPVIIDTQKTWNQISSNVGFSVGIDEDQNLYSWGQNSFGQLGTNDRIARTTPTLINPSIKWKQVSAGKSHIIALSMSGEIYSTGRNNQGQLGTGNYTNELSLKKIGTKNDWVFVKAAGEQTFGIDVQGDLYAWGLNNYGQLGINRNENNVAVPTKVFGNTKWKKVASGEFHSIGLSDSNEIYSWGRNTTGQLGLGNTSTKVTQPTRISSTTWSDIDCGNMFSGAITSQGELFTWGLNNYGQLGIGNTTTRNSPTKVNLVDVKSISFGAFHSFAILQNEQVYCWGRNNEAQLGLGAMTPLTYNSPVWNNRLFDVEKISSGEYLSFAILTPSDTSGGNGQTVIYSEQTLVYAPLNSSISFSWQGATLQDHQVKLLVKLNSGAVLVDETYSTSALESKRITIGTSGYKEIIVEATLMKNNNIVNKIETKFLVRGIEIAN